MLGEIGRLFYTIELKAEGFFDGIEQAQKKHEYLVKNMAKVGSSLTKAVTLPLVGIGVAAFKMSKDFNASIANIGTLIPGQEQRLNSLKKTIQDVAIQTGKSTQDMADGLYQVISAFGDSAESGKLLEISAKAASAGMATTTDAINLLSAVTKGYGDTSAAAMEKTSDLAFMTAKLGQTTFPELAASIGRVVPIAQALGVAQEELFAGFATLTGVTGSAAEVSTQLRGAMAGLMKPTKEMAQAIKSLGYSSAEAIVEQLGLVGAIQAVIGTTDGSSNALGKLFANIEALPAIMALTGAQAATFNDKLREMGNAAGATNAAFKEITEGANKAGFTWDVLKRKVEVLMQNIGDGLAPAIGKAITNLQPLIDNTMKAANWFSALDKESQALVLGIVALVAALGPLLTIASKLVIVFPTIAAAFTAMTGPAGLVVVAIAAVTAAIVGLIYYVKTLDERKLALKKRLAEGTRALAENAEKVKNLAEEWEKLKFSGDKSNKTLDRMHSIQQEIWKINPSLVSGFDAQKGALGLVDGAAMRAAGAYKELYQAAVMAARAEAVMQKSKAQRELPGLILKAQNYASAAKSPVGIGDKLTYEQWSKSFGAAVKEKKGDREAMNALRAEYAAKASEATAQADLLRSQIKQADATLKLLESGKLPEVAVPKTGSTATTAGGGGRGGYGGGGGGAGDSAKKKAKEKVDDTVPAIQARVEQMNFALEQLGKAFDTAVKLEKWDEAQALLEKMKASTDGLIDKNEVLTAAQLKRVKQPSERMNAEISGIKAITSLMESEQAAQMKLDEAKRAVGIKLDKDELERLEKNAADQLFIMQENGRAEEAIEQQKLIRIEQLKKRFMESGVQDALENAERIAQLEADRSYAAIRQSSEQEKSERMNKTLEIMRFEANHYQITADEYRTRLMQMLSSLDMFVIDSKTGIQSISRDWLTVFNELETNYGDYAQKAIMASDRIAEKDKQTAVSLLQFHLQVLESIAATGEAASLATVEAINRIKEALGELTAPVEVVNEAAEIFKASFVNAFQDMATGAITFNGFLKQILNTITQIIAQKAAMNVFGSLFGGLFGGGKGLLGLGGLFGFLADGGTVRSPGNFIVGERGPEMLTLPRGATVTPLDRSGGAAGAMITINTHIESVSGIEDVERITTTQAKIVESRLGLTPA